MKFAKDLTPLGAGVGGGPARRHKEAELRTQEAGWAVQRAALDFAHC